MKCLLIYNPTSGKKTFESEIPNLERLIEKKGHSLECLLPVSQEDCFNKARDLSGEYDCYIIVGGDGTINTIVNGIMNSPHRPKILLIPRGTTNDLAGILGINEKIEENIDILNLDPVKMDIGQVNDKYFCYALACGAFSSVTYEIERKSINKHGYFAYVKQCMKKVGKNKTTHFRITHDIGVVEGDYCLLMLLNSKRVARFNLRLFSEAKMNDGILELRLLKGMGIFNSIKVALFFLLSGKLFRHDKQIISTTYFIETNSDVVWNIDGERGPSGSIEINTHRKELDFYVSPKALKKYFLDDK